MQILRCLSCIAVMGVLSHFIGNALPRSWFDPNRPPFAPMKWEKNGKIYDRLHVHAWKDKLPDTSKVVPGMVRKSIPLNGASYEIAERVAKETCVAELVHWTLLLCSFLLYFSCPNAIGVIAAVLYALCHVPFIIIQRYNRPTLALLAKRLREREERKERKKAL